MTNANVISALVGLLSGAAAAFLLTSAQTPSYLSFVLIASGSLPVLIAGLGWSNVASVTAVLVATGLIAAISAPLAAFSAFLTSLAPAAWVAHLACLARPAEEVGGPEGGLAWYPLSDILFHVCALVTAAMVILGYIVGYGPDLAARLVEAIAEAMKESNPELAPTPEMMSDLTTLMLKALPVIQGAMWVIILFAMFYVAGFIVRASARGRRPKDDIPSQLRMPRIGLPAFAGGIVLTFLPGPVDLIGWAVVGTFGAGFVLSGFALFHDRSRGKPWRLPALWLAYLSVAAFTLPALVFLAFGLSATARTMTVTSGTPRS